jgi:hypothetical protein
LGIVAAHARLTLASRTTLVPVVRREPERQQLLFRHGAARVVPEAVEELELPYSKIRVVPPPMVPKSSPYRYAIESESCSLSVEPEALVT